MKLPNYEQAIVAEAKITKYLLDLTSENGRAKAQFFLAFGFTIDTWKIMHTALISHASMYEVTKSEDRPPFGTHYVIEGALQTPDGRNPNIRTIWIIDTDSNIPRFVSAYPLTGG